MTGTLGLGPSLHDVAGAVIRPHGGSAWPRSLGGGMSGDGNECLCVCVDTYFFLGLSVSQC